MKLQLIHDGDIIEALEIFRSGRRRKIKIEARQFMYITDEVLTINLTRIKMFPLNIFVLPQKVLHEFLHYITNYSWETTILIHKIEEKSGGLIL